MIKRGFRNIDVKVLILSLLLSSSLATASLAGGAGAAGEGRNGSDVPDGPSSNVWIDVVKGPSQARICVTVPMTYGFAVNGTVDVNENGPVSVADGTVLVSNIRIRVHEPANNPPVSGENYDYSVETVGDTPHFPIENYSTDVSEADLNQPDAPRVGLPVYVKATLIKDRGLWFEEGIRDWENTVWEYLGLEQRNYWEAIPDEPLGTEDYFKKYRISLDGKKFSVQDVDEEGWYHMEDNILLPAPPYLDVNGYTAGGLAYVPSVTYLPFSVEVGGTRLQYNQVEGSVKVGTIRWTIEPVDQTP